MPTEVNRYSAVLACLCLATVISLSGCQQVTNQELTSSAPEAISSTKDAAQTAKRPTAHDEVVVMPTLSLTGKWIKERNGTTMLDPQTSGLIADENVWWTISDASADDSQIQRLHLIDKQSATVVQRLGPMVLSETVAKSCFASYLAAEPDYEAMVFHPFIEDAWILVTEDASRGSHKQLTRECQREFEKTGSTKYPTLLVEVVLRDNQLIVSGVRALQFAPDDMVGNSPNDGFEGLALGRDNRLFLSLEKDANNHARIFYVDLKPQDFTQVDRFMAASDAELHLPRFTQGNHPINGMSMFFPNEESKGFLIAAARNDNQLWIIDVSKELPTKVIPMEFFAPRLSETCPVTYKMHNASLEGVAVDGDSLVLVNDPWRSQYRKNIVCEDDSAAYERYSPLIFSTKLDLAWFSPL